MMIMVMINMIPNMMLIMMIDQDGDNQYDDESMMIDDDEYDVDDVDHFRTFFWEVIM